MMDAGDVVTVTLVVSNTGLATAYDLVVTSGLSTAYFDTNTVSNFTLNGGGVSGYTLTVSNGLVWIRSDAQAAAPASTLETNETLVFAFGVAAGSAVQPNTSVTLASGFYADTMAGSPAEQRTVVAPGSSVSVGVPNLTLGKTLLATSLAQPWESSSNDVQIGETATYRLSVTLPESTVTNLAVTDYIPAGMKYTGNAVTVPGGMSVGTLGVTGGASDGAPVTFTFAGVTSVAGDGNPANNVLLVDVDAVVLNTNRNVGLSGNQTVFTNTASVTFAGPGANTIQSGAVYARAVEPDLRVIKSMVGPQNGLVTVSILLTNTGLATAYDIVATDRLDSAFFQTATVGSMSAPAGFTMSVVGAPGSAVMTMASATNSAAPTNSIQAGAGIVFSFTVMSVPNAGRSITNIAVVVSNSTMNGAAAGERIEPMASGTNTLALPMFTLTKAVVAPVGRAADVGETISYLVTVTNLGTLAMGSVLLTDAWPTHYLGYTGASITPSSVDAAAGSLVWSNVGPIAIGGGTNITVSFTALHSSLPGCLTNNVQAEVVTTNGASPASMSASATNAIVPSFQISKTVLFPEGRSAVTSGPAIFLLTVTNTGDSALQSVRVWDHFDPAVLQYNAAFVTNDSAQANSLVWSNLGGLAVGASVSVTGNFTALTSTGVGTTTNTMIAAGTFQDVAMTTLKTNLAELRVTIPVGLTVGLTNPVPSGSNLIFTLTAVSGAVYHVISVSNNIDHTNQNWRHMVTWSNMPSWVSYTDTNVVTEVNNTRYYLIVWEEAGVVQTNPVEYEAFVQNLVTGYWHELSMPVEVNNYALNASLGAQLATGLNGDDVNGDLLYAMKVSGAWQTYMLNSSRKWVLKGGNNSEVADRISPASGYWVKRQIGGVSTNVEYAGPVRLTTEAMTFPSRTWKMFSWPFPRSRREDYASNGWGFAAAGAHGDNNPALADRLYVGNGTNTVILFMKPDGRWYRAGVLGYPSAADVRLQHGVGYYYFHNGSGFSWTAESPAPNTWY